MLSVNVVLRLTFNKERVTLVQVFQILDLDLPSVVIGRVRLARHLLMMLLPAVVRGVGRLQIRHLLALLLHVDLLLIQLLPLVLDDLLHLSVLLLQLEFDFLVLGYLLVGQV